MFVDMRGSTRRAERRLPYDTVFLINQFLNAVSSAVVEAGGQPNQVLGDGLLALFGLDVGARTRLPRRDRRLRRHRAQRRQAQRRAGARAGRRRSASASALNAGIVIAGEIGYERHAQFTVIGDAVNVAARLAGPDQVARLRGADVGGGVPQGRLPDALPAHEVDARGRDGRVGAGGEAGGRSGGALGGVDVTATCGPVPQAGAADGSESLFQTMATSREPFSSPWPSHVPMYPRSVLRECNVSSRKDHTGQTHEQLYSTDSQTRHSDTCAPHAGEASRA